MKGFSGLFRMGELHKCVFSAWNTLLHCGFHSTRLGADFFVRSDKGAAVVAYSVLNPVRSRNFCTWDFKQLYCLQFALLWADRPLPNNIPKVHTLFHLKLTFPGLGCQTSPPTFSQALHECETGSPQVLLNITKSSKYTPANSSCP